MPQPIDTTHQLPPAPEALRPEALREDIERTRARMSGTLDRIEERITERRREMWAKVTLQDVRDAVTTEPWRNLLIAFVAGYVVAAVRD